MKNAPLESTENVDRVGAARCLQRGSKAREDMQKEFATVLEFVSQSRQNIEEKHKQLLRESEEEMVELCLTIAEKLVQSELKENRPFFTQILRSLLRQITDQKRVVMHVNPKDYERRGYSSATWSCEGLSRRLPGLLI